MDLFAVFFPVSGVKINILLPPLIALVISFFTSMGGVSGAFLLLPFQMSFLHYTSPSVSGTNHVFNVIAIPSGVYRYMREGRMAWPLTWVIVAGTLPGVFIGYYARVLYLPDPRAFKVFVGCVLLFVGIRLFLELLGKARTAGNRALEEKFKARTREVKGKMNPRIASGIPGEAVVRTRLLSVKKIEYEFWGETFSFHPIGMFLLAFVVGIVGGAYGIGGGSIIAPFCVAVYRLPVYTIAGAALMGTFITSVAGALFFSLIPSTTGVSALPDWPLGMLFGIGGFVGMYLGARFQKYVPQRAIKVLLCIVVLFVAGTYILEYLR